MLCFEVPARHVCCRGKSGLPGCAPGLLSLTQNGHSTRCRSPRSLAVTRIRTAHHLDAFLVGARAERPPTSLTLRCLTGRGTGSAGCPPWRRFSRANLRAAGITMTVHSIIRHFWRRLVLPSGPFLTLLYGPVVRRRCAATVSHGTKLRFVQFVGLRRITRAPCIIIARRQQLPRVLMRQRTVPSPVDICFSIEPSKAAK